MRRPTPSVRAGVRLSVETFALVRESCFCGISGPSDRDDIDAVKVIAVPLRHESRVAAVGGEVPSGYGFDERMFPSDKDKRIAVEWLFEGGTQPIGSGEAEARIDRQAEEYRRRLDRRKRSDVIVGDAVIYRLLGRVGSEYGARPAEGFGND